jgi:hypothetical protein
MAAILTSILPDKQSDAITTLLTVMVQHAGGDFVGVQDAWPEYGLPPYVLFNHQTPRTGYPTR